MVKLANMVVTDWGDGLAISVSSPQLPGIVAAYDTMPDVKEIFQIALDAGLEQDGQIRLFREVVFEADLGPVYVRWALDQAHEARQDVAGHAVKNGRINPEIAGAVEPDELGDRYLIVAMMDDRIQRTFEAYEPSGRFTILVLGGVRIHGIAVNHSPSPEQTSVRSLGLGPHATFADLFSLPDPAPSGQERIRELVSA